jgi:hypothetical protein
MATHFLERIEGKSKNRARNQSRRAWTEGQVRIRREIKESTE